MESEWKKAVRRGPIRSSSRSWKMENAQWNEGPPIYEYFASNQQREIDQMMKMIQYGRGTPPPMYIFQKVIPCKGPGWCLTRFNSAPSVPWSREVMIKGRKMDENHQSVRRDSGYGGSDRTSSAAASRPMTNHVRGTPPTLPPYDLPCQPSCWSVTRIPYGSFLRETNARPFPSPVRVYASSHCKRPSATQPYIRRYFKNMLATLMATTGLRKFMLFE